MPRGLRTEEDRFTVTESELPIEDGQPDVTYTLRMIPVDVFRKALNNSLDKRGALSLSGQFDMGMELFLYALVDWTGVEIDGVAVPCTTEHKKLLASNQTLARAIADRSGAAQHAAKEAARGESFRPPA